MTSSPPIPEELQPPIVVDFSDALAQFQLECKRWMCDRSSPGVQYLIRHYGFEQWYDLPPSVIECIASDMRTKWNQLPARHQQVFEELRSLLEFFELTWRSDRLLSWMKKRGLSDRTAMKFPDYEAMCAALTQAKQLMEQPDGNCNSPSDPATHSSPKSDPRLLEGR